MAVFEEREDWHARRKGGIGGTDIAAIVGISPWKKPIDVFLAKTGQKEPVESNEFMWWGNYLEAGITQRYAEVTRNTILRGDQIVNAIGARAHTWNGTAIVEHPSHSILIGSPDGLVLHHDRGLEIKSSGWKDEQWGRQGTDEIPMHYLIQCAWYMAVCDINAWDLSVLFGGNRMEIFTVHRNLELEKTLIESGLQFWNDHVLKNTPPPIDSSEQYASYLAKKFSLNPSDIVIDSTKDIEQWAQQLKHAQQQEKFAIEKAQLAKNHLMDLIGGHKGSKGDFGKITWIRPKPSPSTDYEAAFKALSDKYAAIVGIDAPAHVEEIAIAHTSPATKSAYLKATFSKER